MDTLKRLLLFCALCLMVNIVHSQNPNWTAPNASDFDFTSSVVATIALDDIISNNGDDRIAFFVDGQIRGLSTPVDIGGSHYRHYITVYLNEGVENMNVQVYHQSSGLLYNVSNTFEVTIQTIYGSVDDPYQVDIYEGDNVPITLMTVPDQITIEGLPYDSLNVSEYLVQVDESDVVWSYTPNPNLIVSFTDSILSVKGAVGFVGMTSLTVRATEAPPSLHYAETTINYEITPLYNAPQWSTIPSQGIVIGDEFKLVCLDDYEVEYGGAHLEYNYSPILEESETPDEIPMWEYSEKLATNMTLTTKINFTPQYQFNHPDDVLAAFINDELRGVAVQNEESGLYFMTIAGSADEASDVTLKFYSGVLKTITTRSNLFAYEPHKIEGSIEMPYLLEMAPMVPIMTVNAETGYNSKMQMEIIDDTYIGTQTFDFYAFDSLYPSYLNDTISASFCIVEYVSELVTLYIDMDGDGFGDPTTEVQSCFEIDGYVTNDYDCDDSIASFDASTIIVKEDSGYLDNDGIICSEGYAILNVFGGSSYSWNSGQTTKSILVSLMADSTFIVSTTFNSGCVKIDSVRIFVESKVVTNSLNDGHGTLRSVYSCAMEGDTITYDQPTTLQSELNSSIFIDKNIVLKGLDAINRPIISIDFDQAALGFEIENTKTISLQNIDLHLDTPGSKPTVTGDGTLNIIGVTVVTKE